MCELFAMSSLYPTRVKFSLEEFSRHGGISDHHKDGWGIAYYDEHDVRLIKDIDAAAESDCLRFIREHNFSSQLVISHIRHATQGEIKLKNTQPYVRELGGRMHVFVHNGNLRGLAEELDMKRVGAANTKERHFFRPVGDTDSELAFCYLMQMMQQAWSAEDPPLYEQRHELVSLFATEMRELGPFNFIYSDGEFLFIHGHKRRQQEDGGIRPPGLFTLCRTCSPKEASVGIEGLVIDETAVDQKVVLVASVPLTNEGWNPLEEGEIRAISLGNLNLDSG